MAPEAYLSINDTLAVYAANHIWPQCELHVDCDLRYAFIGYYPNVWWNGVFAGIFFLVLFTQLWQGLLFGTWSYLFAMVLGCLLEMSGYVSRILMHFNPYLEAPFLAYLITLTIAPIFFTACIYLALARLIALYDPRNQISHFSPRTITVTFLASDVISFILQGAGGAIAMTANTQSQSRQGVNVMIAGLAFQLFSLVVFILICTEFAVQLRRAGVPAPDAWRGSESNTRWWRRSHLHLLEVALALATFGILIRSVYRVVELKRGFNGALANQEVPFMLLEGLTMVLVAGILTICHPGWALGDNWKVKKQEKYAGVGKGEDSMGLRGMGQDDFSADDRHDEMEMGMVNVAMPGDRTGERHGKQYEPFRQHETSDLGRDYDPDSGQYTGGDVGDGKRKFDQVETSYR